MVISRYLQHCNEMMGITISISNKVSSTTNAFEAKLLSTLIEFN